MDDQEIEFQQWKEKQAKRRKRWLWLSLGSVVVLLLFIGLALQVKAGEEWENRPALMQIFSGQAGVYDAHQGKLLSSENGTLLQPGNYVTTQTDSHAVLQYFETSTVKLDPQTEVQNLWSRGRLGKHNIFDQGKYYFSLLAKLITRQSPRTQPYDAGRQIGVEVLYGKASVTAARDTSPGSIFELWAPGTVVIVQGTAYTANVDAENGNVIFVREGTIRVGTATINSLQQPVIAIATIKAGDILLSPPLPKQWRDDPATYSRLMSTLREVVEKSVAEERVEVSVKETTLLASDSAEGFATYAAYGISAPAGVTVSAPVLPPGYVEVKHQALNNVPVVIGRTTDVSQIIIPARRNTQNASSNIRRDGPPTYVSSIEGLARPLGVAVDPLTQHVFVTETEGSRVTTCYDADGKKLFELVPPGTSPADRAPSYVAVDIRTGNIYVSDRSRRCLDVYDVNGVYLGIFLPKKELGFSWAPLGLSCAGNYLYITDVTDLQHRIFVFDLLEGELKFEFGKEGKDIGQFGFPNDATADKKGRIYVADSNNFRVQVFDPAGQPMGDFSRWGIPLMGLPRGMDAEGDYLYVVDAFEQNVVVYRMGDTISRVFTFGTEGNGPGQFNYPNDIGVDYNGDIYVTDRQNNRLQIWKY